MSENVFRKASLERLSSPEQLDQLTQVTTPAGWVALAALGAVVLAAVIWSVLGRIPEEVGGTGMLVKSGGVFEVVPSAGGRIADVAVTVGDSVTEGQVVARLQQPELADQLQTAKGQLADLEVEHGQLERFGKEDIALQRDYLGRERSGAEQSVVAAQATLQSLKEKMANQQQLVDQGLLTKATVLGTRQQFDATAEKLAQDQADLAQLAARGLELTSSKADQLRASEAKIREAQSRVEQLERELKVRSEVISPYTGRILEIMADEGNVVGAGEPILSLDLTGNAVKDLEAIIYIPPVYGKQVTVGMPIRIAPSTVKQEEYGFMIGRVTYVSDFPATDRGMRRVLKNAQLSAAMAAGTAPYEVHADLLVDPATTSHYRWSSSHGPPVRIQSGTLAVANIEVSARRPIEMVMPITRKFLGL